METLYVSRLGSKEEEEEGCKVYRSKWKLREETSPIERVGCSPMKTEPGQRVQNPIGILEQNEME